MTKTQKFFTKKWYPWNIIILVLSILLISVLIWGGVTNWKFIPRHTGTSSSTSRRRRLIDFLGVSEDPPNYACEAPCKKTCSDYINDLCAGKCPPHAPPFNTPADHKCWTDCVGAAIGIPDSRGDYPGLDNFLDPKIGCRGQCDLMNFDPSTGDSHSNLGPCECAGACNPGPPNE